MLSFQSFKSEHSTIVIQNHDSLKIFRFVFCFILRSFPSDFEMNQLLNACEDYLVYPKNIIQDGALDHTLRAYIRRLREHAIRLFVEENDAALNFLDLNDNTKCTFTLSICYIS